MNENLATELLKEVKAHGKRWFIIAMLEMVVIAILTLLLILVPTDEVVVEQESDMESTNQIIGSSYYGCETEADLQEETRQ